MEPENEELKNNGTNSNENFKLKGPKGWALKLKNGIKGKFKNATDVAKKSKKEMFKAVFAALIMILKVILPAILILAIVWYVVSVTPHTKLVSSVDSYISYSSNISAEAKTAYEQTGSLLYLTEEDIKTISNEYLKGLQRSNNSLFEEVSKAGVIGDHTISLISYADGFNISNAYEFMLNAEKLNFNRVTWKKHNRETEEIEDLETDVDEDTNLIYPVNEEDTTKDIKYFMNIIAPYLQSYVIPSAMVSGVDTKANTTNVANFAFQIIDQAYHDITVLQYTLQTAKRDQTKKHYVTDTVSIIIYEKEYVCTDQSDNVHTAIGVGEDVEEIVGETCIAYGYSFDELEAKKTAVNEKYKAARANETENVEIYENFDPTVDKQFLYPIIKADTLKQFMRAEYSLEKYEDEDVEAFENEDMQYVSNTEEYILASGVGDYKPIYGSGWTKSTTSVTVSLEAGEYITTTYVWNDKLEEEYNESRSYEANDVSEFVNRVEQVVSNSASAPQGTAGSRPDLRISASQIFSTTEVNYYTELEEEKSLTRIDLINAVPSIYNDYLLEDENYSEYIGFSRPYLSLAYNLLNKHLSELNIRAATTNWASLSIGSIYGLDMIWPLDYYGEQTSKFGVYRPDIGQFYGHSGIDIAPTGNNYAYPDKSSYTGSYVYASSSGTVVEMFKETPRDQGNAASKCPDTAQGANYSCGGVSTYGRHIKIKGDNGYTVVYGHLYEIADGIEVGSKISQGQVLGVMGTTGSSTGVHLHFEVRDSSGMVVDPLKITGIATAREILKK